jgi:hypothetical protein
MFAFITRVLWFHFSGETVVMRLDFKNEVLIKLDYHLISELSEENQNAILDLRNEIASKLRNLRCHRHPKGLVSVHFNLDRRIPGAILFTCCTNFSQVLSHQLAEVPARIRFGNVQQINNSNSD